MEDKKSSQEAKLRYNIRIVDSLVYKLILIKTEQMSKPEADLSEKIAQEIKETTTEKKNATDITDFSANVSEEALENMQRLHAALTETLRLYATVRLDGIYAFQDDTLPVGFNVRKGDMVCYLPYAKGRTKFIRGDDEEEYKPERWLDGDGFFTLQAREPLQFQHSRLIKARYWL
ncbi:putative cytochromeC1-like [Capsicum annuum]|nr:putative cytochromeC1-like [Capsicum annuum]